MLTFLLLSGCLIETDRYERRRAELLAEADGDTDGDTDTDCARVRVWVDADGDGFGNPDYPDERCAPLDGWVEDATDCDDGDAAVNPDAEEVCATAADDDCDGAVNEDGADGVAVYADADGDGFGDPGAPATLCVASTGWVADATDCDDGDGGVNPGAEEVCGTGVDDDCDVSTGCRLDGEIAAGEAEVTWVAVDLTEAVYVPSRVGDLSGDGRDDVAIAAATGLHVLSDPGAGEWRVSDVEHARVVPLDAGMHFRTATGGDFDGDGSPDLAAAAFGEDFTSSAVHVFLDGVAGTVEASDATVTWEGYGARARGMALATAGDLNRDGIDELLFSDLATDVGATSLVFGAQPGSGASLDDALILISSEPNSQFGLALAAGDTDGDGIDDLVVTEPVVTGGDGRVLVFLGPATDAVGTADADVVVEGTSGDGLGISTVFEPLLDADGDGNNDLLLGASTSATAAVYLGPVASRLGPDDAFATFTGDEGSALGAMLGNGDIDGDGRPDIVLGVPAPPDDVAGLVFYGPLLGNRTAAAADARIRAPSGPAAGAFTPGDLDGDGFDDIFVTTPSEARLFFGDGL